MAGSSLSSRLLSLGTQLAVENSVVDRWFAGETGSYNPRAPSYRLVRTGFGPAASPSHIRFVRDMAASIPPSVRADTFRAMTGMDLRPHLPQIRVPTVVVIGGRDRLVDPAESRALAQALPRGRTVEFVDAGHPVFLERHEEFNALLRRFAARRFTTTSEAKRPSG